MLLLLAAAVCCAATPVLVLHPPDPPRPNCSSEQTAPRFVLALFGGISTTVAGLMAVHANYEKYVVEASGGKVDVIIHCWGGIRHGNAKGSRNVTESALLELYSPVMARFDNRYDEFWARLHARLAVRAQIADMAGVSQLSSFANVLRLVREAEESFGARYDRVLLARPDVLLWRHLDLRTYCADAVYVNNCDPPFHLEGCLADFHFVMTSRVAENFSSVVDHLDRWRELTPPPHRLGNARNYVERHLGLPLRVDHVVAGRHEEVVRENKLGARLEHYTDCCPCALGCAGHVSAPRHARRRARLEVCARNATRAAEACASIQAEANQSSRLPNLVFGKHAVRDIIKGNDVGTSDRS